MRKRILSCALVLGVAGASACIGVGCSGDDSNGETPDSAAPDGANDTGTKTDSGKADGSSSDTGTTDTGTTDTGTTDTGTTDTGTTDTGTTDTGTTDTGTDTGVDSGVDTGTDTGVDTGVDAGVDTGPPCDNTFGTGVVDGGSSTDGGGDGGDGGDGGSGATVVQLDLGTFLTQNTVVSATALPDGGAYTAMDGVNNQNDFMTQAKADTFDAGYSGLPNNAFFAANTDHPNIQLHWSESAPVPNSRVIPSGDTTIFTVNVPLAHYTQVQLYGVSTNNSTNVQITLTYEDNTVSCNQSRTISDWFQGPNGDEFYVIHGLNRIQNQTNVDTRKIPGISGVHINPNPAKKIKAISFSNLGPGDFIVYGGTAY